MQTAKNKKLQEAHLRWRAKNKDKYNQSARNWRAKNKRHLRNQMLLKKYGITVDEFDALLVEQNNCCKICGKTDNAIIRGQKVALAVDHCHKTGKIRGILCGECNTGLGKFKDSIDLLLNVIAYLRAG